MAGASTTLHEDEAKIAPSTVERHRAIISLMEELEAVDWYDQRVDATSDPQLKALLEHNRDEEKEHAAMMLEWLRRNDAGWDEQLRDYLFTEGPIHQIEAELEGSDSPRATPSDPGSLGIGSLKGT